MSEPETNDSKIQNLLQRIREKSAQGEYIYRGEAEHHGKIASGLYLRYAKEIDTKEFDIQIAQEEMLEQVKAYTDFTDETDVLSELQHYGGKTNLIDFTTDYLIALFFACDGSPNEDGRVILLNKNSNQGIISSPKKNQNNRVISQKSIFFQAPKGYLDEEDSTVEIISIPKEMKQPVLDYLRKYHGITTHTIYSDIFGYIKNQEKHQTAYTEFYIGLTSYQKSGYEDAIKHYDQAIDINPQFAEAYNNRGITKDRLGRHEEAIADYDEAIRINPQFAEAYYNRGTTKDVLGRHEKAIADYDEAIRLNTHLGEAYYNRGNAKNALGRHEKAIADYDEAIRFNPQYVEAYINRGNAKDALGRHEKAIADYNEAIRLNPQFVEVYSNRGNTKGKLGRYEEAIADYDEAIRLNPQDAKAYTNRGNAKNALGRHEKAIADYDEAIRLNPQLAEVYYNRGTAKITLGRHKEAIRDFSEAIRLNPQDAEAYTNRGNANKEIGEYENTRADLQRAFELATEQDNPELAQAARRLLDELPPVGGKD